MYTNSILAVTGVLIAGVAAVPRAEFQHHHQHHPKRDLVWVTEYQEVWETVAVTKTVWVTSGETKPTAYSTKEQTQMQATVNTPAPAPVAAAYVAPAYVAPAFVAPVESEPAAASVALASSYVAPAYVAPSSEAYVAPAPASTYVAPATYVAPEASSAPAPAASSAPAPSYDSGAGSAPSGGQSYTGDFTWYEVGLGACGNTSVSTDPVVAVSHVLFDAVSTGNSNTNPLCDKKVYLTGADGNTYTGTIVDRCPGCEEGGLDLSQTFFNTVTKNGDGRVKNMKWSMG